MITSSVGCDLHVKHWEIEEPKAQVYIVHGYAEHIGRYEHLAQKLNDEGYEVIGHDHAGHGQSGGERAYIDRFDQYVWDLDRVIEAYKKEDLPVFIFGHSMGGLIATSYCTLYRPEVNGIVTTGAGLKVNKETSPLLQKIGPYIGEVMPRYKTVAISGQDISRDTKVVEEYENDPMVYRGGIKARLGGEMLTRIKRTNSQSHLFTQPALFMHGGADNITDPKGSEHFCECCASEDKEFKLWDGLYHELINEPERKKVIKKMVNWLNDRV